MTLWSREGRLLDRKVRPNTACTVDGIRRLDADGIAAWVVETLASHRGQPIEAIIPVAHGAGVAALLGEGLGFPPLDYEQPLPGEIIDAYRQERDPFQITGSPALPDGLNLGAQLYWLEQLYPKIMEDALLVPWAQYWSWFLSGRAVSEVTSLGCHTDLWNPLDGCFSPMARRLGWAAKFAPVVPAGTMVGTLRAEFARRTGLDEKVRILAGLHDSNAALLAARGFDVIAGKEATVDLEGGARYHSISSLSIPSTSRGGRNSISSLSIPSGTVDTMSDELDPDLVIEVAEDYALSLPQAAEVVRATLETQEPPPVLGGGRSSRIASTTDSGAHGR